MQKAKEMIFQLKNERKNSVTVSSTKVSNRSYFATKPRNKPQFLQQAPLLDAIFQRSPGLLSSLSAGKSGLIGPHIRL